MRRVPNGRHRARRAAQRPRAVKVATKDQALLRERREHLIAAAIEVFLKKGFHDATVRDIGRAASMTQGSIYNYVRTKDDILFLVCDRIVSEYQEEARRAIESSPDPASRIRSAVRAVTEVMERHRKEVRLIFQDSHLLDKRSLDVIKARVTEFIRMFEKMLVDATREANLLLPSPFLAANIVTFLPSIIALRRWSLYSDLTHDEIVDGITEFVMKGLGFAPSEQRVPSRAAT